MKRRSSFLTILTLILAGILVFPTDYADAKKSNTARKSSSKKKKKNKSKKKTETVTVNVAEDTSETRASSSSSRRGGTTTTTTTATTTTVVDEATEISNLKSNLLSCLSGQCAGDVSYEKCFKTSNIDVFLAGNPSCQSYLNSASSETVRVLAKQQVVSKVKDYFKESCANAGGKISGETCKLSIYYLAKSPDGKSKVKRDKTVSVGTTFTCSYNNFGLSQQNLEYKAEQSVEDKIAGIQAVIQVGTGLLSTGAQVFGAINAQKSLKRAGAFVEDAWYKFDGTNLTDSRPDNKYWYGASGVGLKKAEEDQCGGEKGVDDNGAKYCRYSADSSTDNYDSLKGKTELSKLDAGLGVDKKDCSTLTADTFDSKEGCYVYIEKSNEFKKAEKLKELISKLKDLSALKAEAAEAQDNINFARNYIAPTYVAQAITLFTPGATLNVGVADAVCPTASRYFIGDSCSTCQNKKDVRNLEDANKRYILDNGGTLNFECHNDISGSGYSCANRSECHWDSKQGWLKTVDRQGSSSGGDTDGTSVSDIKKDLDQMKTNAKTYRDGLKYLMTGDEEDKKSIKTPGIIRA